MKKILIQMLAGLLVISLVLPFVPQLRTSSPLSHDEMSRLVGGETAVDCGLLAAGVEAYCRLLGGGWLTCLIISGGTYVACLGANALT